VLDTDDERLTAMREQYERSSARETASKVAYVNALVHALNHAREDIAVLRSRIAGRPRIADDLPSIREETP
jgi:hypothetical protein